MVTLVACKPTATTELRFVVKHHGNLMSCDESTNLLWYLSEFRADNAIEITPSRVASNQVALIGGQCSEQNWRLSLQSSQLAGKAISFTMAVPFQLNHLNPLTADAPLNVSEMFWSWQLGHKFFRYDDKTNFSFHLGSTGCKSPSRLRAPTQVCSQPNRFRFTIANFKPQQAIVFDLDKLLFEVDRTASCMSEQDNPVCSQLFKNLQTSLFYQE